MEGNNLLESMRLLNASRNAQSGSIQGSKAATSRLPHIDWEIHRLHDCDEGDIV
jgi:hypothetical protein